MEKSNRVTSFSRGHGAPTQSSVEAGCRVDGASLAGVVMRFVAHPLGGVALGAIVLPAVQGCLCPPCPAGAGAVTATAPAAGGAAKSTEASAAPTADRLVIWDGDKVGAGQSWADCAKKDQKCKSALTKASGAGFNGGAGLKWHGEGPDWMGGGWNWFGWYPQDTGTSIVGYSNLTFQIKVDAKTPDLAPDPDAIAVFMRCGNSKIKACNTATLPVHKYVADFADGQWHKATIPIADLTTGEGAQFDPKTAWEFDFTEWSGVPRDFNVYVDDIAVEK